MRIKKYMILLQFAAMASLFSGCQNFDEPAKVEFDEMTGVEFTSIKDLKTLCGNNNNNISVVITDDIVIKGTVSTTDRHGNFYRSFFIQDETSGIEIKHGKTQLYNTYKEGQTIYVKLKGLCLGRTNGMVSIGAAVDEGSTYQNTWIDNTKLIDQTIIRGPYGEPVKPIVVSSDSGIDEDLLGMMVTFEKVRNTGEIGYCFYYNEEGNQVIVTELDTWGIPNVTDDKDQNAGYGSHYFQLESQKLLVRSSGYSAFAAERVDLRCAKGETANITAIFTKYQKGTYSPEYQLMLNTSEDVVRN